MTFFKDLTPYNYGAAVSSKAVASNVGWLAAGVEFQTASPDPKLLDRLWQFCKVSIGQTRGLHKCELCCFREANFARRNGEELLIGSAEIRVVYGQGIYAAPNLIYHYVASHEYSPPSEFVRAVLLGTCPPEKSYYEQLSKLGVNWSDTLVPQKGKKSFKFVKTPEGVIRVEE